MKNFISMSRNKIVTTGFPKDFDLILCNSKLCTAISGLNPDLFESNKVYTFQVDDSGLVIVSIQGIPFREGLPRIREVVHGYTLERYGVTFHQTDDLIREHLYTIIDTFVPVIQRDDGKPLNLIFIGGECYLFPFFFKDKYEVCPVLTVYTDFRSIYLDALYNHPDINANLVSYSDLMISGIHDFGIINLSHELPESVWQGLKCKSLLIIRCYTKKYQDEHYTLIQTWKFGYITLEWYQLIV